MKLYTIGFTRKSAARFFGLLRDSDARRVIDIRRRNTSGLAGFSKKDDLAWFLRELCDMDYIHLPRLAPSDALLDAYRQKLVTWDEYVPRFGRLTEQRLIPASIPKGIFDGGCLLCAEPTPDRCHRRLVAELLQRHWGDVEVVHLV